MGMVKAQSSLQGSAGRGSEESASPGRINRSAGIRLARRVFSFPAFLGALLVAAVFPALRDFTVDSDLWWHLKVGEGILATHHWPTVDTYSFTARGTPWLAYEWLGETLLAAVHRAWGLPGLMALDLALGAAILLALYALAWLRSHNSKAAFVSCALLMTLAAVSFSLRPQMLGYLFLILTLIILERFRQGRAGALWVLPVIFLVWVNTHGSFVVGFLALGVYGMSGLRELRWGGLESVGWTGAERLRLGLVFLTSLVAVTITPYGTKLAAYPIDVAFSQPINVSYIREWQPLPFNIMAGKLFLAVLVGFLLAQVVLRPTWQLAELTLFLCGTVATCLHARFVLVFVPVCAPLLAVILSRWLSPYDPVKDPHVLNLLLMAAVVAGVIRFFPTQRELERSVAEQWPVRAVQYLERHPPPQPMFNNYGYGGYLIYALDGRNKVFVDGRVDIYERQGVLADYRSIGWVEPNTLSLLRAYNVQSCLIERDEPLATLLAASSEWQKDYADGRSVLFARSKTGGQKARPGD
jgi:hypothetical protein